MPKGALLHAHLEATVDASTLLRLGLEHDNMCIRVLGPISPAGLCRILPQFGARPVAGEREYMTAPTITDASYVPESWVSARRAREEWPAAMGGPAGFDAWVVKSMVINPEEAYGTHNTTRKIWMKFVAAFTVIYVRFFDYPVRCAPERCLQGIITYEPVLTKYLRCLFELCAEDGIQYLEVRMDCTPKGILAADGVSTINRDQFIAIFKDVCNTYVQQLRAAGKGDLFRGAKVWSRARFLIPNGLIEW